MFWSRFYIPTLKENPADADVISHTLMVRSGMIRKLSAGVYTYMPYGWRAIAKVAEIVRQEMNRITSAEMVMPTVQPAELWQQSGRWTAYGRELLRFKDRHERDCCLGPTHEEVITDIIRGEARSYRQLPISVYQIQTKFRDEVRPRFGLMRGREFIMKDAYTFDRDDKGADKSYWEMFHAYEKIFDRLALGFKSVAADSGSIGGNFSHEFMVLADTGEDSVAACKQCEFAANIERAEVPYRGKIADGKNAKPIEEISTPGAHTV
ncbi:MAG: proline--tRNA ligase, partial [Desulfovibrio sp.]|nr:proline--tRNA ligase [Desulfovibrio sp.]